LGGSFNASSGFPIEPLGSDPVYGDGIVYILQRGTTSRAPWVTSFDAKVGVNYRLTKDSVITASVEGFNLFNSQRPVQVDNRYTHASAGPILGRGGVTTRGGAENAPIPNKSAGLCPGPAATTTVSQCAPGNGSLPTSKTTSLNVVLPSPAGNPIIVATNPNWA